MTDLLSSKCVLMNPANREAGYGVKGRLRCTREMVLHFEKSWYSVLSEKFPPVLLAETTRVLYGEVLPSRHGLIHPETWHGLLLFTGERPPHHFPCYLFTGKETEGWATLLQSRLPDLPLAPLVGAFERASLVNWRRLIEQSGEYTGKIFLSTEGNLLISQERCLFMPNDQSHPVEMEWHRMAGLFTAADAVPQLPAEIREQVGAPFGPVAPIQWGQDPVDAAHAETLENIFGILQLLGKVDADLAQRRVLAFLPAGEEPRVFVVRNFSKFMGTILPQVAAAQF